jgi:hypothetical protein
LAILRSPEIEVARVLRSKRLDEIAKHIASAPWNRPGADKAWVLNAMAAVDNLERALRVLDGLGYAFEAGGEPFVDLTDEVVLTRVVENGTILAAIHPDDGELDLLTSIPGFDYSELSTDATEFEVAGSRVRVGQLEKLLKSKQVSGRPKDREFLRAFRARSCEDE